MDEKTQKSNKSVHCSCSEIMYRQAQMEDLSLFKLFFG